ncbi:hypothetical protein HYV86_04410 [Candidatus Woesearchaeota archaeon]|nr:hypothetical protein [Candidatus Woesearchaeota archaeon]
MRQYKTVEEAYDICLTQGEIVPKAELEKERIKSFIDGAIDRYQDVKDLVTKKRWVNAYIISYDVLHQLTEAYILFDKIKVKSHLCLFSYLCVKHPTLEISWDFFEKVRTKRNGVSYYGTPITQKDWQEVSLQFSLYIGLLKERIEEELKQ